MLKEIPHKGSNYYIEVIITLKMICILDCIKTKHIKMMAKE